MQGPHARICTRRRHTTGVRGTQTGGRETKTEALRIRGTGSEALGQMNWIRGTESEALELEAVRRMMDTDHHHASYNDVLRALEHAV